LCDMDLPIIPAVIGFLCLRVCFFMIFICDYDAVERIVGDKSPKKLMITSSHQLMMTLGPSH
jgi:uncharacterized YccA/Bax inhibitor family protein